MNEVCGPAEVGANVMPKFLLAPPDIDAFAGPALNWGLLEVTELIVSAVVPVFVTVTLSVFELPSWTLPIESFLALTEKAPASTPSGERDFRVSWA
jgi:hypothetical protein